MDTLFQTFGGIIQACVIFALLSWNLHSLLSGEKLRMYMRQAVREEMDRIGKRVKTQIKDPGTGEVIGFIVRPEALERPQMADYSIVGVEEWRKVL